MANILTKLLALVIACAGVAAVHAQGLGSLEVSGRVKIEGKQEKLTRKRFYLLKGGLAENKPLIDRLRDAEIRSRSCYYTDAKASPEFICWLKRENCESPYCRSVKANEVEQVPEFKAAYQKGLTDYKGSKEIALNWIMANLSTTLSSGFYQERRKLTSSLLGGLKPLQSSMTDSVTVRAIFIDIPIAPSAGKKTETFLLSNILPIEFGDKSYLWACEVEIGTEKPATMRLSVPEGNKPVKNCEVFIRDLKVCNTGGCPAK
jgi:hypothetical protein